MSAHLAVGAVVGLAVGMAALATMAPIVEAQGIIIDARRPDIRAPHHPRPQPHPRRGPAVVLVHHGVEATIRDTVTVTRVSQVFENRTGGNVEGTYVFPIPPGATLSDFSLNVGGQVLKAEVLDKDRAAHIYEEIVRKQKDPGLLELMGNGLVRARLFPIPPHGRVEARFTIEETLAEDGGLMSYRYPLRSHAICPVPVDSVSVVVDIDSSRALSAIYSPSHDVDVQRRGEKAARVSFEKRQVEAQDNFLLHVGVSDQEFGLHCVSHRPPAEDGYFHILISPARDFPDDSIGKKDFVFILDTSGSMQGVKFQQAVGALRFALERLHTGDRFNLVAFSTEARPFRESLVEVNEETLEAARRFIAGLSAVGGTNMSDALHTGLRALQAGADGSRVPLVVFLTDGLPTVGTTDVDTILTESRGLAAKSKSRLFVFGVGHDVNTILLDRLAEENRGSRDYVSEQEDIEVKVGRLVSKIESPVLSDLSLKIENVTCHDLHPKALPDLFKGGQISIVGRYDGGGRARITLTGRTGSTRRSYTYEATLEKRTDANDSLPRLWASRRIGTLLDALRLHGDDPELRNEVERLGKRYGIVTPYTSLLVTEGEVAWASPADQGGWRFDDGRIFHLEQHDARTGHGPAPGTAGGARPRTGPGGGGPGLGEGADAEVTVALGGPPRPIGATPGRRVEVGRVAVEESLEAKKLRESARAEARQVVRLPLSRLDDAPNDPRPQGEAGAGEIIQKTVGSKVFLKGPGGIWKDSLITADMPAPRSVVTVEPFSPEYFALLTRIKELAPIFAIGEQVEVLYDGVLYKVLVKAPAETESTPPGGDDPAGRPPGSGRGNDGGR